MIHTVFRYSLSIRRSLHCHSSQAMISVMLNFREERLRCGKYKYVTQMAGDCDILTSHDVRSVDNTADMEC